MFNEVYSALVNYNLFAANKIHRQYSHLSVDELKQEGRIAIYKVCRKYKYKSVSEILQIAKTAIFRSMFRLANSSCILYGSLYDIADEFVYDDNEEVFVKDMKEILNSAIMTNIQRDILVNFVFPRKDFMKELCSHSSDSHVYIKKGLLQEYIKKKYNISTYEYLKNFNKMKLILRNFLEERYAR